MLIYEYNPEYALGPEIFRNGEGLVAAAGRCSLAETPGKNNWVEHSKVSHGHLPEYICRVARALHRDRGLPKSMAIAIAIGVIRDWASGRKKVKADTRGKAMAAIAEWEAMKAEAASKRRIRRK